MDLTAIARIHVVEVDLVERLREGVIVRGPLVEHDQHAGTIVRGAIGRLHAIPAEDLEARVRLDLADRETDVAEGNGTTLEGGRAGGIVAVLMAKGAAVERVDRRVPGRIRLPVRAGGDILIVDP